METHFKYFYYINRKAKYVEGALFIATGTQTPKQRETVRTVIPAMRHRYAEKTAHLMTSQDNYIILYKIYITFYIQNIYTFYIQNINTFYTQNLIHFIHKNIITVYIQNIHTFY